jgi:hypothetical protein
LPTIFFSICILIVSTSGSSGIDFNYNKKSS